MLPTVTAQQIKDAMPQFQAGLHQHQPPADVERLSLELRVRCALADYILNGKEGTLEDRVYGLVAEMPMDIERKKRA